MRASACPSPGKAEGGTGRPPPQKKNNRGGRGGGRENSPQPPNRLPTPPEWPNPPPEGTEDRTPKEAQGDHPAKTGSTKPGTTAQREKGHRNKQRLTTKKQKKSQQPSPKERGWGTGTTRPGTGTPSKKQKTKAQKAHPDNQAKKGWAQPRPGPSTNAHTARQNGKWRGASGARTQPHTSHKQAETEPQPQTPQTAGTRGTAPQTVPKHTHPRPQPGLVGSTKPTPNRKPDPNTNAAQQ